MTVRELIAELLKHDMEVEVRPYCLVDTENIMCEEPQQEIHGEIDKVEFAHWQGSGVDRVWIVFDF
ncbi:hypothetical protein [Nitratifractor sp.]